jgi:hypothetical protein
VGKVNEAHEKGSTIIVPQAQLGEGHMRIAYQVTHMRTVQQRCDSGWGSARESRPGSMGHMRKVQRP